MLVCYVSGPARRRPPCVPHRVSMWGVILSGAVVAQLVLGGCVSVPREAPELSAEVGHRIDEFERSHVAMLHALMDERRAEIDRFIETEWIPTFSTNLLRQPQIQPVFDIASDRSRPETDRLEAMSIIGTEVQMAINRKRVELMTPIDELERELERRLRDEYRVAGYINNLVTTFLISAADVADLRDRYAEQFGIDQNAVRSAIDETNLAVDQLNDRAISLDERSDEYLARVKKVLGQLGLD